MIDRFKNTLLHVNYAIWKSPNNKLRPDFFSIQSIWKAYWILWKNERLKMILFYCLIKCQEQFEITRQLFFTVFTLKSQILFRLIVYYFPVIDIQCARQDCKEWHLFSDFFTHFHVDTFAGKKLTINQNKLFFEMFLRTLSSLIS